VGATKCCKNRRLGNVDPAAVAAERTARFPGTVVTVGRHGPDGSDGRADSTVPKHGDDGGGGSGMVTTVEEEWDGAVHRHDGAHLVDGVVPGHNDGVEAVGV
jgi:hypothetical protein